MAEPARKAAELAVSPHDQPLTWLHSSCNCREAPALLSSVHEPCMVPQVPCPQRHMMQKAILLQLCFRHSLQALEVEHRASSI